MKDVSIVKKIFVYLTVAIVIFSGFEEFFIIPELNYALYGYQVRGFIVVTLSLCFYAYFASTDKKQPSLITNIITFIGYGITAYIIISNGMKLSDFGIGFYIYFSGLIPFVISMLLQYKEENDLVKVDIDPEKLANVDESGGTYLVCNYITGVKKAQNIYKSISVLIKKNNSNTLDVNINAPEEIHMSIEDSSIEKVIISRSLITHVSEEQKEDNTLETQYIATVLVSSFGPAIGQQLAKDRFTGIKTNFNVYYKVEIKYKNDEESRLVFHTNDDPSEFFKKYENILEIID